MAYVASSYIKTTSAVVARVRDSLSFSYTARPQAATMYVRFVETGGVMRPASQGLVFIGATGTVQSWWGILNNGPTTAVYYGTYKNGPLGTERTSFLAAGPTQGDTVELL